MGANQINRLNDGVEELATKTRALLIVPWIAAVNSSLAGSLS
jgi:hypothetical protein